MVDQLLAGATALLLYPGALLGAVFGVVAEAGAAWALKPGGGAAAAGRAALAGIQSALPRPPAIPGAVALLALLAATQVAAPFNPLPAGSRNSLVAAASLMAASWLAWAWAWGGGGGRTDPRLALTVQACWLLALLLPSIAPQNLRPQVLGAIEVPALLPLKLACGALYLACLAPLLQIIPETAPQGLPGERARGPRGPREAGFAAARALLWLPYCGLGVSLFFPPASEDALGILRFLLLVSGVAALAIAAGAHLARRPPGATRALYNRIALPFAAFTILVAALTQIAD